MNKYLKLIASTLGVLAVVAQMLADTGSIDWNLLTPQIIATFAVWGVPNKPTKPAVEPEWVAPPGFKEWVQALERKGAPKLPDNFDEWLRAQP